jgi:hypothetical protein
MKQNLRLMPNHFCRKMKPDGRLHSTLYVHKNDKRYLLIDVWPEGAQKRFFKN